MGFETHCQIKYNKDNIIAIASLLFTLGQLCAVGFKALSKSAESSGSSYDKFKLQASQFCRLFLFDPSPYFAELEKELGELHATIDFFRHYTLFLVAVACAVTLMVRYGPVVRSLFRHAENDGLTASNNRMSIDLEATSRIGFTFILQLLADTLCTSVMASMESMLSCTRDENQNMKLAIDPTVDCFWLQPSPLFSC